METEITLKDILEALPSFSKKELRTINKAVIGTMKLKDRMKGVTIRAQLFTGQTVKFRDKTGLHECKILKVNRTCCRIDYNSTVYTLPISMIEEF